MTKKTKAAVTVLTAVLVGALTGCGDVTVNGRPSDDAAKTPATTTDSGGPAPATTTITNQDGSSSITGAGSTTLTGPDGSSYVADQNSLSYTGPEGTFQIDADHTISVSFLDGTTCSADINERLNSSSGSSGMRCTIYVYSDGEVNLTVEAADGTELWKFESAYTGTAPEIHKYVDGQDVGFP